MSEESLKRILEEALAKGISDGFSQVLGKITIEQSSKTGIGTFGKVAEIRIKQEVNVVPEVPHEVEAEDDTELDVQANPVVNPLCTDGEAIIDPSIVSGT